MKKKNRMVEVFKTRICDIVTAENIIHKMLVYMPSAKISFDLEDCDKVLRVEDECVSSSEIMQLINGLGHYCEVLV